MQEKIQGAAMAEKHPDSDEPHNADVNADGEAPADGRPCRTSS
jgi:hypothetical protein